MKQDFVSIADLSREELDTLLGKAAVFKRGRRARPLEGKTLALLFEKPSLRTKVSFDVAIAHLGGHAVYLSPDEVGMSKRESTEDVARVLSRYVDGIVARTFAHRDVELLAQHATVPVINALSDGEHPCQALADLLTIQERKGPLAGKTIGYVGDGNNVAASLALGAAMMGACYRIASPEGYELPSPVLERAGALAKESGGAIEGVTGPDEAVRGADVVYTDVWASMGQESQAERRRAAFADYQVTEERLSLAKADVIFMHPLPAHHGEEVALGLLEHPKSVVFDQAENRLHVQKALLIELLRESTKA